MSDQAADTRPPVTHGHVDDPGDLQLGDHGLNGDLRAAMLSALEKNWQPDGAPDGLPDDNNDAATAAGSPQPDPATTTTQAPTPGVEDGAGAGGEAPGAGDGAAPDPALGAPAAPAPTPAPDDQFSLDAYARDYFGTSLTPDQARELFGIVGGLQSLTPEQRRILDQTLAGGQPGQYPATIGQPTQPQHQQQPPLQPQPPYQDPAQSPPRAPAFLPPRPDDEYEANIYDRYLAPLATQTEARLAAIQADIERTTQAQLARENAEMISHITRASDEWRSAHQDLTDGEYDALVDRVTRSGVFAPLVQAHGSPYVATQAALDQFFWADPNLRARAIANTASGRAEGDATQQDAGSPVAQQQASTEATRQARAASVAGGGGRSTPRGDQQPTPTDTAGRKSAMVNELASNHEW